MWENATENADDLAPHTRALHVPPNSHSFGNLLKGILTLSKQTQLLIGPDSQK
jgi:hypothetical protein